MSEERLFNLIFLIVATIIIGVITTIIIVATIQEYPEVLVPSIIALALTISILTTIVVRNRRRKRH